MNLSVDYHNKPDMSDPLNQRRRLKIEVENYTITVAWDQDLRGPVFAEVECTSTIKVRAK